MRKLAEINEKLKARALETINMSKKTKKALNDKNSMMCYAQRFGNLSELLKTECPICLEFF